MRNRAARFCARDRPSNRAVAQPTCAYDTVVAGRNPESRFFREELDSGFGAAHRPGMTTCGGRTSFDVYFVKNTSRRGNFSNTDASTEKFVARMSVGLPAIHWERSIVW
jgi:hypothetical protein